MASRYYIIWAKRPEKTKHDALFQISSPGGDTSWTSENYSGVLCHQNAPLSRGEVCYVRFPCFDCAAGIELTAACTLEVMISTGPGASDDVRLLSNTLATGPVAGGYDDVLVEARNRTSLE